jgi:cell division protein FtsZ
MANPIKIGTSFRLKGAVSEPAWTIPTVTSGTQKLSQQRLKISVLASGRYGSLVIRELKRDKKGVYKVINVDSNARTPPLFNAVRNNRQKVRFFGRNAPRTFRRTGKEAMRRSYNKIASEIRDADIVIVTPGLEGDAILSATLDIQGVAKKGNPLIIGTTILPFSRIDTYSDKVVEREIKMLRGVYALNIIIQKDRLMKKRLPLKQAKDAADRAMANIITKLTRFMTERGLIDLDYADITSIIQGGYIGTIGIGQSLATKQNGVLLAMESAISSPLMDVNLQDVKIALIEIEAPEHITIKEVDEALYLFLKKINNDSRIIFNVVTNSSLKRKVKVFAVLAGIEFTKWRAPQIKSRKMPELSEKDTVEPDEYGSKEEYQKVSYMKDELSKTLNIPRDKFEGYYNEFSGHIDEQFAKRGIQISELEKMIALEALNQAVKKIINDVQSK